MRRSDKILNLCAQKDIKENQPSTSSTHCNVETNIIDDSNNGYLEVDTSYLKGQNNFLNTPTKSQIIKNNNSSNKKKPQWFCNRGFSSPEKNENFFGETIVFDADLKEFIPECINSLNQETNEGKENKSVIILDQKIIKPGYMTPITMDVNSVKNTSSPEKNENFFGETIVFDADLKEFIPECINSLNRETNEGKENESVIILDQKIIKPGYMTPITMDVNSVKNTNVESTITPIENCSITENPNSILQLSQKNIEEGTEILTNSPKDRIVQYLQYSDYLNTPVDPFHASSSDDSLYYPSSSDGNSSGSDIDKISTKKKRKKLSATKEVVDNNISLKKINVVMEPSVIQYSSSSSTVCDLSFTKACASPNIKTGITKQPYKRKPDYCYFCETKVLNFGRHVLRNHSTEMEVAQILAKPVNSKERKQLFSALRRKGNYLADGRNCFKPVRESYVPGREKIPCSNCLGYFSAKLLYRHRKKCIGKDSKENASAGRFQLFSHVKVDRRLKEEVFPHMRADKVSLEAQKDALICEFGSRYLKTHREQHFIYVTSRKMRELSKMLLEIRKLDSSITSLVSSLKPQNFNIFVEATRCIANYDSEKDIYMSPTFAMNIVTSLKQCCDIAITFIYTRNVSYHQSTSTATIEADLKTLIRLFESNWSFEISSHAANNLNLNKWNKVTIVPLATDLRLLREHLINVSTTALKLLTKWVEAATKDSNNCESVEDQSTPIIKDNESIQAFNNLIETIYCRVILLNRKRSGELQRMYLHTYLNAPSDLRRYEEFDNVVSAPEKFLLQSLKRVVIRGKRGKGVPVLFHSDIQQHLKLVMEIRDYFVPKNNPYLFGVANSTLHLIGYKVLSKHAKLCGAQNPSSITSTRLRKHLATLSQLFNLSDGEIEQLATFMGHTPGVHRNSYRLPDDVYQTAKISKLLMVMEKGGAGQFKGKSIDEIDINLEENLLDNNNANDDSDEENDENDVADDLFDMSLPSTSTSQNAGLSEASEGSTVKTMPKNKRKRTLVPWTNQQKEVTLNYFKSHIERKIAPKKLECEDLRAKHGDLLINKDWLKIKVFVQNTFTKGKGK